jgi:hypothetical protein
MVRSILLGVFVSVVTSSGILAADPQTCSPDLAALFRVAEQESHGLWVTDRNAVIGGVVADEKFHNRLFNAFMLLPGWYPVDGTKRIVCGALEYWNMFKGPSPEQDLHAFIVPSPAFRPIIDDLPPFGTLETGHDHVWGEVTPPAWFKNFWSVEKVPLSGGDNTCGVDTPGEPPLACHATMWAKQTACMYGPWVMERVYHYRVEIHPMQAVWGQDGEVLRVFVLSDDSKRFEAQRSYRRITAVDKWKPWNKPISPTIWIAAGAAPPRTLSISITRGSLSTARPSEPTSTPIDLGGVSVNVSHPRDLQIGRGPACRLPSGDVRGFVAVSASGNAELDALDITGDVLKTNPVAPPAHPQERPTNTETERGDQSAPSIDLRHIEWDPPVPLSPGLDLSRTRSDWGFSPPDAVKWTAARTQRLQLAVTTAAGATPPSDRRFWIDWSVEACNIEGGGTGSAPVPLGTGNNDLYLEIARGARLALTAPDGVTEKKNAAPYELKVFVRYPVLRELRDTYVGSSIRVRLAATLRDSQGRTTVFRHVLRNVAPDFSSSIQPYNVEQKGGAIPEDLIKFSVGWLQQQGVPVTRPEFERDWSLAAAMDGQVLGPLENQPRRRIARTLRLSLLTFLEDETLDAEEMKDLLEMLKTYADAVWGS